MTIRSANLVIDPELCKRLDRAIYGNSLVTDYVRAKADLYRTELVNLIASKNQAVARMEAGRGLYRLYTIAERLILDESAHTNEMMHGNMQTAHNQLKNWK